MLSRSTFAIGFLFLLLAGLWFGVPHLQQLLSAKPSPEAASLYPNLTPAKNTTHLVLHDDGRKIVGWLSGTGPRKATVTVLDAKDAVLATFNFGDKVALWDCSSCSQRQAEDLAFVTFYGDKGSLALAGGGSYKIYDLAGKEIGKGTSEGGDRSHFVNFFECIRSSKRPNSDIEEGQKSTLLCHLGNIAYRTGRTLTLDPKTRAILDDKAATAMRGREYQKGWAPKM